MTKTKAQKEVLEFCRRYALAINTKGGVPMLSSGEWYEVFDTWQDAHAFLVKAKNAKTDEFKPYPWEPAKV